MRKACSTGQENLDLLNYSTQISLQSSWWTSSLKITPFTVMIYWLHSKMTDFQSILSVWISASAHRLVPHLQYDCFGLRKSHSRVSGLEHSTHIYTEGDFKSCQRTKTSGWSFWRESPVADVPCLKCVCRSVNVLNRHFPLFPLFFSCLCLHLSSTTSEKPMTKLGLI